MITTERAVADVAEALYLEPDELDLELDLRDQGMDSVRVMELVERWREAGAAGIDFIVLSQDQRLSSWLAALDVAAQRAVAADQAAQSSA